MAATRRYRRFAGLGLLLVSLGCRGKPIDPGRRDGERGAGGQRDAARLRLLSLNVFGVPFRDHHEARLDEVAPAVAKTDVDVVALQEVWRKVDAERLAVRFASLGFRYQRWFASEAFLYYGSSGLFVASRLPIVESAYYPYEIGTAPFLPWHPDWYSGKGVIVVDVETPAGVVHVANTHLQAPYSTYRYGLVRVGQVMELALHLRQLGPERPLVLAGDINVDASELPFEVLVQGVGLAPVFTDEHIDNMLLRSGTEASVSLVSSRDVFEEILTLDDGTRTLLSDHLGIRTEVEVRQSSREAVEGGALSRSTAAATEAALDSSGHRRWWTWAFFILVAVGAARIQRRAWYRKARTWRRVAFHLVFGLSLLWLFYLSTVFAWVHAQWIAEARAHLRALRAQPR